MKKEVDEAFVLLSDFWCLHQLASNSIRSYSTTYPFTPINHQRRPSAIANYAGDSNPSFEVIPTASLVLFLPLPYCTPILHDNARFHGHSTIYTPTNLKQQQQPRSTSVDTLHDLQSRKRRLVLGDFLEMRSRTHEWAGT